VGSASKANMFCLTPTIQAFFLPCIINDLLAEEIIKYAYKRRTLNVSKYTHSVLVIWRCCNQCVKSLV